MITRKRLPVKLLSSKMLIMINLDNTLFSLKVNKLVISSVSALTSLSLLTSYNNPSYSAEEFNNLTCVVGLKTEQTCNIAIHKRAMVIKFESGRTNIVKLHKIGKFKAPLELRSANSSLLLPPESSSAAKQICITFV